MYSLRLVALIAFAVLAHVALAQEAYQREMLRQVNEFRQRNGARPLCLERRLITAAEVHSRDMAARRFMDHTGSNGKSPFQRMRDQGYQFSNAAENIAFGSAPGFNDVARPMNSWINSAGHRRNLLNAQLKQLGVARAEGACRNGRGRCVYWTQVFGTTRNTDARCL
ncbi:allergen V5/Tpx-1 family protein [Catenaria anguillulae PL171]|uniref:Allergen V5/Tpx-1 family protein n=1 Tax=Catenaria anguillulae PL171 TaxID=765915 RepID=A0A1Y2I2L8_9FUNG|nr:allergen V5/Tpx-1 family protein [Catenaria anguillulae PL171]